VKKVELADCLSALSNVTALARVKFGNMDPDANTVFGEVEKAQKLLSAAVAVASDASPGVTTETQAWDISEKVRMDLDRKSCPSAFMDVAVTSVVRHTLAVGGITSIKSQGRTWAQAVSSAPLPPGDLADFFKPKAPARG
jgi:hypothetical protein